MVELGVAWCFSDLVARIAFFGADSNINIALCILFATCKGSTPSKRFK